MRYPATIILTGLAWAAASAAGGAGSGFQKLTLSLLHYSEGATVGDFDGDGVLDVASGPFIYQGPAYAGKSREFYPPKALSTGAYSDNMITFTHDVNADGKPDIIFMGPPGRPVNWWENPGDATSKLWTSHSMLPLAGNESPAFEDLTGDGKPEFICGAGGKYGWAEPNPSGPGDPWIFRPLTTANALTVNTTHGLGIGDINGDGRKDFVERMGWWEQPASLAGNPVWKLHPAEFRTDRGGAQIGVYDVDGDGDNDVITSLDAHAWGLAWFENVKGSGGEIAFTRHMIMGTRAEEGKYGAAYSQPHAFQFADMDGDGLKDIVGGKRVWAHGPTGTDPETNNAPSALYWWKLVRSPTGAVFKPNLIDTASGSGTQFTVADLNKDGKPDIVIGNKRGSFVFLNQLEGSSVLRPGPAPQAAQAGRTAGPGAYLAPRFRFGEGWFLPTGRKAPVLAGPEAANLRSR